MSEVVVERKMSLRGETGSGRERVARILREGQMVGPSQEIPNTEGVSNNPRSVIFQLNDERAKAVAKSLYNESEKHKDETGIEHLGRTELAVAWIAEAIRYNKLPVTTMRNLDLTGTVLPKKECIVTEFLPYQRMDQYKNNNQDDPTGLLEMLAFDLIIWNMDRHEENALVSNQKEVVPIDHGVALTYVDRWPLRVIRSDSYGRRLVGQVDPEFTEGLKRFLNDTDRQQQLNNRLSGLLSPDKEIAQERLNALYARMRMISELLERDGNLDKAIDYIYNYNIESAPLGSHDDKFAFYSGEVKL